jgi:hypothetical protein
MVTTKKVAAPGTEPAAKRAAAKPAPAKAVTLKPPVAKPVAEKPVAVKAAAKKPAATKTAVETAPAIPKKVAAPKKAAPAPKPVISEAQRNNYVEVAAFYIAERRGFAIANPADDWAAAEAEIDRLIASGHFAG